ncbi:hypothetical protein SCLCIDRAFT_1218382 [Scleroderma citrinum Foug A]|uniref:Uncharacterized protein n=1 Tax=Scleroderma citrinum Foug A TaxID=1036808 RepID=A0A0C3DDB8_9AGAM|nr:hypothetical protein SCLCIDRAFT_1218382 [Scleroderma citrinum Foug A]
MGSTNDHRFGLLGIQLLGELRVGHRYQMPYFRVLPADGPQLRQVYLRYQDLSHRSTTFEIDDSALTENGITCCDSYPEKFTGNTLTLTSTNSLCTKVYSDSLTNHRFVVGFGQSFGKEWIHVVSDQSETTQQPPWGRYAEHRYYDMLVGASEHVQRTNKARSVAERYGQISSGMWKSSRMSGVKLEVFHDPGFGDASGEWTAFDVDVGGFFCTSH